MTKTKSPSMAKYPVRKMFLISENQSEGLRKLSYKLRKPISELVREGIDIILEEQKS